MLPALRRFLLNGKKKVEHSHAAKHTLNGLVGPHMQLTLASGRLQNTMQYFIYVDMLYENMAKSLG